MTLLELLVVSAIIMIFLGAAALAFVQVLRANEAAQARLDAVGNARHALEVMSIELKSARMGPPDTTPTLNLFVGSNETSATGDRVNEDSDGRVDEETVDGLDDDGDWTAVLDGRHAELAPGIYERGHWFYTRDLGDGHVDIDTRFGTAQVVFRTFPTLSPPSPGIRQVRFYVGSYDGEPNVLLREVTNNAGALSQTIQTAPLAFNVLSFSALFWNQNSAVRSWQTSWDAGSPAQYGAMPELPPTVYLTLTVYAGTPVRLPPAAQGRVESVTLRTAVNIESVMADPRFSTRSGNYQP